MSLPRPKKPEAVLYIDKIDQAPIEVMSDEFAASREITWTPDIIMSEAADKQQILKDKNELNGTITMDPVEQWEKILASHERTQKRVAIYETGDECGSGLKAVKRIKPLEFLRYSGAWTFADKKKDDRSYVYYVFKKNGEYYGKVDGLKYRHYADFANHADEGHGYTFSSESIRKTIAITNAGMYLLFRPDTIKSGPPLLLALRMNREINPGEPIVWNYGTDSFFLGSGNIDLLLTEKFFNNTNGAVIDSSCYTINEFRVRINIGKLDCKTNYTRDQLDAHEPIIARISKTKFIGISHQEIQAAVKQRHSRYLLFSKPSIMTENVDEFVSWKKSEYVAKLASLYPSPASELKRIVAKDSPLNTNIKFSTMLDELKPFRENSATAKFFDAFDIGEYNKSLRILCFSGTSEALKLAKILVKNNNILAKDNKLLALDPNEKPDGTKPSAFDFARDKLAFYKLLEDLQRQQSLSNIPSSP
ncbi:MAG TPA: hypothetical protein VLI69_00650 [Gammaproteobacteria bacterium]|nr:hypothetical protein [Gammaproteobacteria bacterium]